MDRKILDIIGHPRMFGVEFSRPVAIRARHYCNQLRLKPLDAIHLASAVEAAVDVFMTDDKGFPRGRLIDGVWVDEPYRPGDEVLPGT